MSSVESQDHDSTAEGAVGTLQMVALALSSAADLPGALVEIKEAIGRAGFAPSRLHVDVMDEDTKRFESYPIIVEESRWHDDPINEVIKSETHGDQRPRRWAIQQLHGSYTSIAVPTTHGVATAVVPGRDSVGTDFEDFLGAASPWLQLIAMRARDWQRQEDATQALERGVDERTAELYEALMMVRKEVEERRIAQRERSRAQQFLEHVIRSSPAVVYSCKTERGFPMTFVSDNVAMLSGFTPQEIIDDPGLWLSLVHPDDVARLIDETSDFLETGSLVCEYRLRHKDGSTRWIHDEMRLIRTRGPRPEIMGSWLDISERVQSEAARRQVEQELESQRAQHMRSDRLRSLGEMAAGIAHELNQPLVGVRGKAEHIILGLERGWDLSPQTLKDRVTGIVEQADRMEHIIEHVRMFAREAGNPKMSRVQLNDVVNSAIELLGAQFRSHGVDLATELASDLPLVMANPFSLEEVLLNLLANARDAVEEAYPGAGTNEGKVSIKTGVREGETRRRVSIELTDNGNGVSRDHLERVFEPFYTTKDPDKGTGLGLSVSRSIVEQLDGRIWMESAPGNGTKVSIVFPVAEDTGS